MCIRVTASSAGMRDIPSADVPVAGCAQGCHSKQAVQVNVGRLLHVVLKVTVQA